MKAGSQYKEEFIAYINKILCESIRPSLDLGDCYRTRNPEQLLCPLVTNDLSVLEKEHETVQRKMQHHTCSKFHCMKRGIKCRYGFPKPLVKQTNYSGNAKKLQLARNATNYNTNNSIISAVLRCNMDMQFIPGAGRPEVAR